MSLYDSTGLYDQSALTYNGSAGGVAGLPTVGVFIGFDDSPYVAEPSWTEITSYVREIPSIRRARSDDWSTFTGSATLTLNNRDQRFNPYNTASPYYGKLLPRRQIKIVADAGEYANLITNPSFETDLTGWTFQSASLTRIADYAYSGGWSMRLASNSALPIVEARTSTYIDVEQGQNYTASAYVLNINSSNRQMGIAIRWYNSSNVLISTTDSTPTLIQGDQQWVRLSVTSTPPANAVKCVFVFYPQLTKGNTLNRTAIDGVMFTKNNSALQYFDGNTGGYWSGTANNSISYKVVRYPIFRGYIAGWPVEWSNNDEDSTVSIECFDALSLLADQQIPNDHSYAIVADTRPIYWFRGDDADGAMQIRNIGSRGSNAVANFTNTELALKKTESLADGIPFQANTMFGGVQYKTPTISGYTDTSVSISSWYSLVNNPTSSIQRIMSAELNGVTAFFGIAANGTINASATYLNYTYYMDTTLKGFNNTGKHHFVVTFTGGTLKLYVDGRDISSTVNTIFTGSTPYEQVYIGDAALQETAVWNYALTAAQIRAIYNAGNAEIPETTSARIARLLTGSSFPSSLVSVPASPKGVLSEISTGDAQLVNEFDLVRNSEGGELYVSKDGVITFTQRDSQLTGRSAVTQAVFKDDGTALKYAGNFTLRFDADSVVNDLRYDVTGDAQATATDTASINAYGQASKTVATQIDTAANAQPLVNSRLAIFDSPIPAVSPLEVGITRSQADWQNLLSLELMDQIEVTRTPKTGSVFNDRLLVNEINHSITPAEWSMTITGSARFSEWFTIDIDFIDGDRLIA